MLALCLLNKHNVIQLDIYCLHVYICTTFCSQFNMKNCSTKCVLVRFRLAVWESFSVSSRREEKRWKLSNRHLKVLIATHSFAYANISNVRSFSLATLIFENMQWKKSAFDRQLKLKRITYMNDSSKDDVDFSEKNWYKGIDLLYFSYWNRKRFFTLNILKRSFVRLSTNFL